MWVFLYLQLNMSITDAKQAANKFMEDLKSVKLKKEKMPNQPPHFKCTKEQVQEDLKVFNNFLDYDLFNHLKSL